MEARAVAAPACRSRRRVARSQADAPAGGHYFAPVLFGAVDPRSELAQEEVFGPVLSLFAFDTEEQAIDLANGTEYGLIAGIWADKFDQIAAFQNFVILPLTFLSGVFYSIHSLPPLWQAASHLNPFFYMIDGFRYGFFGVADFPPVASFAVVAVSFVLLSAGCLLMLRSGYKLRQ